MEPIYYDVRDVTRELTTETARFVARANCADGIRRYAAETHPEGVRPALARGVLKAVRPGSRRELTAPAQRLLRVSWQTEVAARAGEALDDPLLRRVTAQTLPVQTYYAVFNGFRAMATVAGTTVDQHTALQQDFAKNRAAKMPLPWSVTLEGDPDDPTDSRLVPKIVVPSGFNPVSTQHSPADYVWAALRMARRWKVEVAISEWKRHAKKRDGTRYKALPRGKRAELVAKLRPTTVLDFAYELRRQANYETSDEYASDANDAQVTRFHRGMTFLIDSGLLLAEASIVAYCGTMALKTAAAEWQQSAKRLGAWATAPLRDRLEAIDAAST